MSGVRTSVWFATTLLFAGLFTNHAIAEDAGRAGFPQADWPTAAPEDEGMDSAALVKLIAYGKTRSFDSVLVVRHGRIVLDASYAPYASDRPHVVKSTTKAVIGTLIALLLRDGVLDSLDHPVVDFFRDRKIENLDDRKKAITVRHLLNMTSGLDWDEGLDGGHEQSLIDLGRSTNWVQYVLDRPMALAPGEAFYYSSGGTHLLSAIITKLTGKPASDYANDKLFGPLGIAPPFWQRDPQGITAGGFGLSLKPRDMARIGYLYLRGGRWGDQQVVPPDWIETVNHATVDMRARFEPGLRYANLFWALPERHVFMSVGYHCQMIMVMPQQDIVAVTTARDFCGFRKVAETVASAVQSADALPRSPDAAASLARAIADVAAEKEERAGAAPETAASIAGKVYNFQRNPIGLKSLGLTYAGTELQLVWEAYRFDRLGELIRRESPIGMDGRYRRGSATEPGTPMVKGAWTDARTLLVDLQTPGQDDQRKWALTFAGSKVTLKTRVRYGQELTIEGEAFN
ncbi:beta-lactamase family protein [Bradyrhizobium ontarionense]|uniref:Beta-lactamase family protein n=1 Tax=Bradyrhizobium ontarionense TaxID=2898149 RepID=A0ABY3RBD2_9BRAD|nr:serine hydrolase [Bradyrhizobium sp. A19]UFZ04072.1 beta-lactamase family protein [Bradyrhizobium sp. A19]